MGGEGGDWKRRRHFFRKFWKGWDKRVTHHIADKEDKKKRRG